MTITVFTISIAIITLLTIIGNSCKRHAEAGLGFRVQGLEFRVWGQGLKVKNCRHPFSSLCSPHMRIVICNLI